MQDFTGVPVVADPAAIARRPVAQTRTSHPRGGLDLMVRLTHGMPTASGPTFDLYDFAAVELFILPALVIGWLNGRAALAAALGVRHPSATPRPLGG
ncbi:MAG TPA: hypothetical protein DCK98_09755 [Chloroflexi bacterium]|jgi:hypothetical protein|nr:hypothetical protein [Chloroflexota bacterium]HAL26397.1 hypothetical protein [Chloroflexota bacterium]